MAVSPGTRIGPYEVVALLGTGGMGEVYRAIDPRLGREVAIKLLPEAKRVSLERDTRFDREARLLASISHPNIATIHGLEDLAGSSAIVMELVDGPYRRLAAWDAEVPWFLATAHAAVGVRDEALGWLDRAIDRGMIDYPFFSEHDWFLDSLRGEVRFQRAMERVEREWDRFEV